MVKISVFDCGSVSWTRVFRLSVLAEGEAEMVGLCDTILERAENLGNHVSRSAAWDSLRPASLDGDSLRYI